MLQIARMCPRHGSFRSVCYDLLAAASLDNPYNDHHTVLALALVC